MGFSHWRPGQVCFFSSMEASVPVPGAGPDCRAPRLAAQGPDRSTGCWEVGPRGGGVGCLKGMGGAVILLGKSGEDVSAGAAGSWPWAVP